MANQTEIAQQAGDSRVTQAQPQRARPHEPQSGLRFPVDIFENSEGITLQADMPGVSKERLNLRVEGNSLLIEGTLVAELQEPMEPLFADIRSTLYRRTFTLSSELEAGKIDANLKDGVLTVRIPKRAELRPRRIEVTSL